RHGPGPGHRPEGPGRADPRAGHIEGSNSMNSYRGAGNRLAAFLSAVVILLGVAVLLVGEAQPAAIAAAVILFVLATFIPQSLMIAGQWERAVVPRMGRLQSIQGPGVFWIFPILDRVAAWVDQRIQTTEFNAEQALSKDTVPVNIDAVVFWQIHDAERAA